MMGESMESSGKEILDRILKDAREKAESIIVDARKSAETVIEKQRQSARQNAEKKAASLLKRAANDADIIRGKVSTDIKRQAGWIVLSEKNRLITSVLNEAKKRLVNMQKSEDYVTVLEKLIVHASTVLGGGMLEVVLNENDSKLAIKFDKLEKEISDRSGVRTQLEVSEQKTKDVGVIVKTIDDQIFVDNTFEAILSRRERELRLKIARILFSNMD
jgi:vacuolar-type H+-ATPase subunit E/Vma4